MSQAHQRDAELRWLLCREHVRGIIRMSEGASLLGCRQGRERNLGSIFFFFISRGCGEGKTNQAKINHLHSFSLPAPRHQVVAAAGARLAVHIFWPGPRCRKGGTYSVSIGPKLQEPRCKGCAFVCTSPGENTRSSFASRSCLHLRDYGIEACGPQNLIILLASGVAIAVGWQGAKPHLRTHAVKGILPS